MSIIATYHIKGGVGKTASAVNIAYMAARKGLRVLLWDVDPQGAATYYFRIKAKVKGGGEQLLKSSAEGADFIKGSDFENLDLIPADFSLRNMDLFLDSKKKRTERFARFLKPLEEDYDLIVLDCPPTISLVSENVFRAADALLIPIIPTTLSLRTLDQLTDFCAENGLGHLTLMPFFSMVDKRRKLHCDVIKDLPKQRADMLKNMIPNSSDVERMGLERKPVAAFAPRSAPAKAYEALLEEILGLC